MGEDLALRGGQREPVLLGTNGHRFAVYDCEPP
jgi:hypothetical protein